MILVLVAGRQSTQWLYLKKSKTLGESTTIFAPGLKASFWPAAPKKT